jgi:hypothetical protein
MTAKAQTQTKQAEAITTNKRAAKKPAAPKKTTTSAAKKAVEKVSAGVKAKAAAPKKPTTTKKPSAAKLEVVAPAAPAKKSGNFSEIEEKHDAENVESLTAKVFPEKLREVEDEQEVKIAAHEAMKEEKIAAMEAVQALASNCTKIEKHLEFLLMCNQHEMPVPAEKICNDVLDLLKGCVDQDGKLKIGIKPLNPRGGRKTQSKVNGSSALRAFWAELIDRPEGATREELFEGGKKNFPDLSPKTLMSQLSQLRLGYDYGVSIHPEYSGRKATEINGVYTWLPAEETKLEDYRIAKKTVGPIEMIGTDGRVWAGSKVVG